MTRNSKALLVDITKCIGCHACEQTCKELHGFSPESEPVLSATAFTVIETRGDRFVRRLCMNCQDPACASACPVGALKKTALGPVTYEGDRCIGCRYCMIACPFSVPKYEWSKALPLVRKCDMCADRVARGEQTACAEACPTGATKFGDRDALIEEGRERIVKNPGQYVS